MDRSKIYIVFFAVILYGCSSRYIFTDWKAEQLYPKDGKQGKILVAAILKDNDILVRQKIEAYIVNDLSKRGYQAVSALNLYGASGLAGLGEEGTYLKLFKDKVAIVITIALADKTKQGYYPSPDNSRYPSVAYYNRIWSYRKLQDAQAIDDPGMKKKYFWESILFNLSLLEPECVIRSRSFAPGKEQQEGDEFIKRLIAEMSKKKILRNPH